MMRTRAFTVAEVLIVVAVIGVAGGLASLALSDQVRQARAKADAKAVVLRLQAEHRAARERLQPLKIRAETGRVVFQRARGVHCAEDDGPPTTATFEHASLQIGGGVACFNGHGEPDNAPHTVIVGSASEASATPAPPTAVVAAVAVGMAVTAPLDDQRVFLVPLRLDRTGVRDDPAQIISTGEAAAIEETLQTTPDAVLKDVALDGAGTFTVGGGQ